MSQEPSNPNKPIVPETGAPPPLPVSQFRGDTPPPIQLAELSSPWVKRQLWVAGLIALITLAGTLALVQFLHRRPRVESVLPSPPPATRARMSPPPPVGMPPPDPSVRQLVDEGNAHGRNGDWPKAFECFRKVVESGSSGEWDWSWATGSALASGETTACERYCLKVLELFGNRTDAAVAERCAKQCLALPGISGDLLNRAVERAEYAFRRNPDDRWSQYIEGLAEYRMGRWSNTLEHLRQPERSSQIEIAIQAWCVGAMARHRLGDGPGARDALSEANRRLSVMVRTGELGHPQNNTWDNFARTIALRREAEQLILGRLQEPPVNPLTVIDGRRQWQSLLEIIAAAESFAQMGQWSNACVTYAQALGEPDFDWEIWELRQSVLAQQVGAVFLKAGDTVRHEALVRALVARTNEYLPSMMRERYAVVTLVKTGHLSPEPLNQAIAHARPAFEDPEAAGDRWRTLVRIMAEFRADRHQEAIQAADTLVMDNDPTVRARALIFRGMARQREGRRTEARMDLQEATVTLSLGDRRSGWWNVAVNEVALEEFRQLLASPPIQPANR